MQGRPSDHETDRGAAGARRVDLGRLRLRLRGMTPAGARALALGIARELAAAAPTAGGFQTRLRVESGATDPARLARRLVTALVGSRPAGPR